MTRILTNCKKVVAAVMLCMIVVCAISSASQASGANCQAGRQYSASKGYRSITKVQAYEDNGVAKKITATARIGENYDKRTGYGEVKAFTGWISYRADAKHAYVIGAGGPIEFVNNSPITLG